MIARLAFLGAAAAAAPLAGCSQGCTVGSQQGYRPEQPIAFSHANHAGELQMDCLYCHSGAEHGRHAGVPAARICMGCHAQVKKDSPEIAKVVRAIEQGEPIRWTKVHRLPDHAYFDHSRHVATGGVACQSCHGPVETMVRVEQVERMTMGWCLDCHRTVAARGGPAGPLAPPTDCAGCHY